MARSYPRALITALPQSPDVPDKVWADELIKQLYFALSQLRSPASFKTAALNLSDAPVFGYGLSVGDVYSDNGVLKIVQTTDIFAPSYESLGYLGTVTTTP